MASEAHSAQRRNSTHSSSDERRLSAGDLSESAKSTVSHRSPRVINSLRHTVVHQATLAKSIPKKLAKKLLPHRGDARISGIRLSVVRRSPLRISGSSHSGTASLSDETVKTIEMEEGPEKPPIGTVVIEHHGEIATDEEPEIFLKKSFHSNHVLEVIQSGGPIPIVAVLVAVIFCVTRNTFILRIYPILLVFYIMEIVSKWCQYVAHSNEYGLLRKGRRFLGKMAQREIMKSYEGGIIRRRMEVYTIGVWHEVLKQTYHMAMYGEPSHPIDLDD